MSDSRTSDWIRTRREALHISQEELARRLQMAGLDVTRATVSHWENGRYSSPLDSAEAIRALADALEISVNELLVAAGWHVMNNDLSPKERRAIAAWRAGHIAEAVKIIVNE